MPLTDFQKLLAQTLAPHRSPSSHLAGAAALHLEPESLRKSNDLDYFQDQEQQVAQAFSVDRQALEAAGFTVEVLLSQPGFVRAFVSRDGASTKVEWAHVSAWRFLPPLPDPVVGFRLHPLDLAINKVLALAGRDEARDFLDVLFVHARYLSLGSLCWAAVGKDPGYGPEMLVELLARKGRYRPEEFAALELESPPNLLELKATWLGALADARQLVRALPPADAGCLYWSPAEKRFVTPSGDLSRLRRHFGSPGGLLPQVGERARISDDPEALTTLPTPPPDSSVPGPRKAAS